MELNTSVKAFAIGVAFVITFSLRPAHASSIEYSSFDLDAPYKRYLGLLKEQAPNIAAQNQCDAISYATNSSKGTASKPVFYYTCSKQGSVANIFVTLADLQKGKVKSLSPIDLGTAREQCQAATRSKLNYPSTFSSGLFDWGGQEWPNGRRRVTMNFKAKNGLGLELPLTASCLFIPNSKGGFDIESEITNR